MGIVGRDVAHPQALAMLNNILLTMSFILISESICTCAIFVQKSLRHIVIYHVCSLWSDMSVVLKLFDPSTEVTGEGSLVSMPIINDSLPIPSHAAVLYTQLMQVLT